MQRIQRPISDVKANWTEVPAGMGWAVVDEETVDTADYVSSTTASSTEQWNMQPLTLAPGEATTNIAVWTYLHVPAGQTLTVYLVRNSDSTALAQRQYVGNLGPGPISFNYAAAVPQSDLNNLSVLCVATNASPAAVVYQCYLQITTTIAKPADPTGLRATVKQKSADTAEVTVAWDPVPYDVTGYQLLRKGDLVYDGPAPRFVDQPPADGSQCDYTALAYNESGFSPAGTITIVTLPPPAPVNLTAVRQADGVALAWDFGGFRDGFRVYRSGELIHDGTDPEFVDTDADPAATDAYSVAAYNAAFQGAASELAWVGDTSGASLDSVSTADAAPGAAPYRISDKPGHDTATVAFTPRPRVAPVPNELLVPSDTLAPDTGDTQIKGWIMRLGGSDAHTGIEIDSQGSVIGSGMKIRRRVTRYRAPVGEQQQVSVSYAELPSLGDGPEQISVYVNRNGEGWA